MEKSLTLTLADDEVRFTVDGRMVVVDAIKAVSASENPDAIWQSFKQKHPEVSELCQDLRFGSESSYELFAVVDGDGWEYIQPLLFDHMLDESLFEF